MVASSFVRSAVHRCSGYGDITNTHSHNYCFVVVAVIVVVPPSAMKAAAVPVLTSFCVCAKAQETGMGVTFIAATGVTAGSSTGVPNSVCSTLT
eukprot:6496-Heterococcus_DN1.PRE.1